MIRYPGEILMIWLKMFRLRSEKEPDLGFASHKSYLNFYSKKGEETKIKTMSYFLYS